MGDKSMRSWRNYIQVYTGHWRMGMLTAIAGTMTSAAALWPIQAGVDEAVCAGESAELCNVVSVGGWEQLVSGSPQTLSALGLLALNALLCLAFGIIGSHPVMGPIAKVRRHIKTLVDGDYGAKVQLRSTDRFSDLVTDVNDLSDRLKTFAERTAALEAELARLKTS